MERGSWTDERLDDMVARIDSQFELLRTETAELRVEMRSGFTSLSTEIRSELRGLGARVDDVGARIDDTRRDMFHGAIAIFGSIVAMLAVLLAQSL